MDKQITKVVWRSVAIAYGELCVMTSGVHQTLKLSADNWDIQQLVSKYVACLLINHSNNYYYVQI